MPRKEKTKSNAHFLKKQFGFLVLVFVWILLIVFKNQFSVPVRLIIFTIMVILTGISLYFLNKSLFGLDKGENHDSQ
ncbi:MAG: hypothetical protein FWF42_02160 [Streptococcaceae bacterium]|nr:hypothetical protein [Streptococcaceae bacterium]MCL2681745.1 hypothetical protein [Streptococcaceae bacterium]MCL2858474.1 hypothetical protein [Streptococcaceae bacterium]